MPVRTRTLFGGTVDGNDAYQLLYTCPAGHTAILRSYLLYQQGGIGLVALACWRLGQVEGVVFFDPAAPDTFIAEAQTWIALEPGDELRLFAETDHAVLTWLSGPELDGVAP